ncbi:hypothetical protein P9272_04075, partial [Mesorhizobium sp. WSM4976]|uniref:hypothetical protein n=1 Tax=Mesorhizobium sp. WSM4976 TaxID=3038549 RepID=UPI002416251F
SRNPSKQKRHPQTDPPNAALAASFNPFRFNKARKRSRVRQKSAMLADCRGFLRFRCSRI